MRQEAWLCTVPFKDGKITRGESIRLTNGSYVPAPLNGCEYLCRALQAMGFCIKKGEGLDPFDIVHADKWDERLEFNLTPLEIKTIVELSAVFVGAIREYSGEPMALEPYEEKHSV